MADTEKERSEVSKGFVAPQSLQRIQAGTQTQQTTQAVPAPPPPSTDSSSSASAVKE